MANKIYKDDIGTEIILDTGVDITSATTHDIKYKKPDGTLGSWTGTIKDTTKVSYTIIASDLDQSGEYEVQAYIVMTGTWRGETVAFTVYDDFA
jgi:hypothetical protein